MKCSQCVRWSTSAGSCYCPPELEHIIQFPGETRPCPAFIDREEAERRDRERETPRPEVAPATRAPKRERKKAFCPECGADLYLEGHMATCRQHATHRWHSRASGTRKCPRCGLLLRTFGLPDPAWPLMYRLVYHICTCGYCTRESRRTGPAPNGRGHGGQRFSPQTGRLLARS